VKENSKLGEKYTLVSLLGQGTFGKVVRAIDIKAGKEVAVKIIRAVPKVCHSYCIARDHRSHGPSSIVMLVASSFECCRPSERPTNITGIVASNFETASTGEGTSA
jgi:serine/threonine protein kinase